MGNGMRQEWEIYVCYIEYITEMLLLNCINKRKHNKSYFIQHKKKLYSQKLFLYEKEKTQKAGKHHTDEIEAHRYQVADELKGEHIHT